MTRKSLKHTLTAAVLTLVAGAAYGQDNAMTTKIPFAFRAAGSDLPAGRYRIGAPAGTAVNMQLQNIDTGKTVYIRSNAPITESKAARPRLIFQCGGEESCSLARLWSGTGNGLEFATPPLTANQRERRETVYLERFQAK
jgi:hypothetical protein